MNFTWKDYAVTALAVAVIVALSCAAVSALHTPFQGIAVELRGIAIACVFIISMFTLLALYAALLRTIVPFKECTFSANDPSLDCFIWKQTVFTYEWTASILSYITPVLLRSGLYQLLGAKIEKGVLIAGKIVEPQMVSIGAYSNIGEMALLMAHAIVRDGVVLKRITIGKRVAIGAHAVVMPGVEIGDEAIVGAGALVLTDTKIPSKEAWGGVPARKLMDL